MINRKLIYSGFITAAFTFILMSCNNVNTNSPPLSNNWTRIASANYVDMRGSWIGSGNYNIKPNTFSQSHNATVIGIERGIDASYSSVTVKTKMLWEKAIISIASGMPASPGLNLKSAAWDNIKNVYAIAPGTVYQDSDYSISPSPSIQCVNNINFTNAPWWINDSKSKLKEESANSFNSSEKVEIILNKK